MRFISDTEEARFSKFMLIKRWQFIKTVELKKKQKNKNFASQLIFFDAFKSKVNLTKYYFSLYGFKKSREFSVSGSKLTRDRFAGGCLKTLKQLELWNKNVSRKKT